MSHPEKIGKYPIVRTLGEGAMGVVYEAFDPIIRRPLAIKTIRRALIESEHGGAAAVARFKTEAQAAGGLAHPGIASVYEYGEDERCAYIAMEFVSGNTLREYISRKTRFAEEDVLSIMTQLLDALAYAHSRRVLHRDIKPANLMITRDGRLKITDFGIAKVEANGMTLEGAVIGTPGYMAPEQFSGDNIDHRVDLYAAAASLYQVLTGQLPFSGSLEQVMYKTVMGEPTPPSQISGAEHWRHFDPVVMRGLAKDRDERYESAAQFSEALAALARQPIVDTISEHTLIMERVRPDTAGRTPSAIFGGTERSGQTGATARMAGTPSGSQAGSTPTSMDAPVGWDPAVLAKLEGRLARHIGPMAKVLVRRAARETTDMSVLQERLAAHLGTASERTEFLGTTRPDAARTATRFDAVSEGPASQRVPGTVVVEPASSHGDEPVTQALLDHAGQVLAARIGPIARVLVKRASAQAGSRGAFCASLSRLAADSTDPASLLRELQKLPVRG
ncbi:MAG TPA: serine/threonine-protein kinase [Burkholderiaceae bacterium]|nr:serine/threonine-protein kinase [Burkholderiaceae bacterium]